MRRPRRGPDRIWLVATASIVVLFWFGSSSASAYEPLPVMTRMILPALPGILVLAALATDRAFELLRDSGSRIGLVVGLAVAVALPGALSVERMISRARPETSAYAVLRAEVADRTGPS